MAINVNNAEADQLTRKFAALSGVSITEAIVIAMKEAIDRRVNSETPAETANTLREKYGFRLSEQAKQPLERSVFDDMWSGN